MSRKNRVALIQEIEKARDSRVIAYVTGDRQGMPPAQIGEDAVRPLYRHVRGFGANRIPRIDLFLYSRGGGIEVPWRIVTTFREHCDEFNVLIPYKAHSAATMIALGADNIVIGKKGELAPIDPGLNRVEIQKGERTAVQQEEIRVEDVMSYISFIKDKAGLGDQSAISSSVSILGEKLNPWMIGAIYRAHSYIRMIARKLLANHKSAIDEQRVNLIIETLAEKMYFHGHAIGRNEAKEIGLPIVEPDAQLEESMWTLFERYEDLLKLSNPFDVAAAIPADQDERLEPVIIACIESASRLDGFCGDFKLRNVRQMPPQLNLNIPINLQLPPNIDPNQISQSAQAILQQLLQQVQGALPPLINRELQRQAPLHGTEARLQNASWRDLTAEEN